MSSSLPEAGELLEGKYRIERVIGEGAWGEVLEGLNVRIKRRVAIKVLKAQYASNETMVSRFEREALASTHIESPHVVQIFDAGVLADGRPYMVMEFLVGDDLAKRIESAKGKRLPIPEAVGFCIQIARGLAAAHSANIFHRDMKPSNIVIAKTKSGREVAKIVDFGISKLMNDQEATSNTQTGTIMGSPVYMSPEQARGAKNTDHRSDIYSLGVVLYECITGRTPFVADSFNELLFKIALEEAPTPQSLRADIDDELNAIIVKATTRAPESRYQTATEFEQVLVEWLQKNGGAAEWATDTGSRAPGALEASATRGKSLPDILLASPTGETPGSPATTTGANRADSTAPPPVTTVGKETGTSLSKTADPTKGEPNGAAPSAAKKNQLVYVLGAAAVIVLGIIGITTMNGKGGGTDLKPDTKTATSAPSADHPLPSASTPTTASAAPSSDSSATPTSAVDAGATATSATADPKPAAPTIRPTQAHTQAPNPAIKPPPTASTSVGGRTIRTDF